MIKYRPELNSHAEEFVTARVLAGGESFGPCEGMAFSHKNGGILAGVVFHNYSPSASTVEMSAASDASHWLNRENLTDIFDYAFKTCGCRLVVARHSETNNRAIRLWGALGAIQYKIPDLRQDGEAEIISIFKQEDWRNSKLNNKRR